MKVLGFDPGSVHTGYGVILRRGAKLVPVAVGRLSSPAKVPLADRLARLSREARDLLERFEPQIVVLETPFHGVNSRSLVALAQARGVLLAASAECGAEICEYSPAEVKAAVAGHGRADKTQVAKMVRLLLHLDDDPLSSDATDALAVAICCAQRRAIDRLAEASPRAPKRS